MNDIYVVKTEDYVRYGDAADIRAIDTYSQNIVPTVCREKVHQCASAEVGEYTIFMPEEDSVQMEAAELMTLIRIINSQLLQ